MKLSKQLLLYASSGNIWNIIRYPMVVLRILFLGQISTIMTTISTNKEDIIKSHKKMDWWYTLVMLILGRRDPDDKSSWSSSTAQ